MRRGSTPTHVFTVDLDLTDANIYVSYEQDGRVIIEKTGEDLTVTPNSVTTSLTQEDTLSFHPGEVLIQLRYVKPSGEADASNILRAQFERIIKDGVIYP